VVTVAHRPELDRRDSRPLEADRVRGSVLTDRQPLLVGGHRGHRGSERLHERVGALDDRRRPAEDLDHLRVGELAYSFEDLLGVLVRQVADVDVDHAGVWHPVQGVTAQDPPEVDRRPIEEVR